MTDVRAIVDRSPLPRHEAERLLMAATGRPRPALFAGEDVDDADLRRFRDLERRRLDGHPLQYLEGSVPFGPALLAVDERVLVPRPETEELFERVVASVESPLVIVDLCTGSGNLAIALAASFPAARVFATDVSPDALAVARSNADRNDVNVAFGLGDLFDPLPGSLVGSVDLLVANPPYLAEAEVPSLPPDVRREPRSALVAGPTGLEIVDRIGSQARRWLAPGAVLWCEVSEFHAVRAAESMHGLDATVERDLFGKDRFVVAHAPVE